MDKQDTVFSKQGLAPLRDPVAFAMAQIVPGEGWTVEWADFDIQIGADTLWLEAMQQAASDEDTRTFLAWRVRHWVVLSRCCKSLGYDDTHYEFLRNRQPPRSTLYSACL